MSERPKILIVDDDNDMLSVIRRTLRREDYELETCNDPREAIERLNAEAFDVLLSDVDMPGLTGHDVTRYAREVSPSTVRVLVTGNATMDAAVRAINEGEVHRFIRKPFEPEDLREVVREALARKRELELLVEASQQAERRKLLHEQLEHEHPGISVVERDSEGVYAINTTNTVAIARQLGLAPFLEA